MRKQVLYAMKNFKCNKSLIIYFKYYPMVLRNLSFISNIFKSMGKTLEGKGMIFSIVGADGSGKSTLIKDLYKWLSWKLVVQNLYYGKPKTGFLKYLSLSVRGFNKFRLCFVANILNNYMYVSIARSRFKVFKLSQCFAASGYIVITDRFPLKDFWSMQNSMDGPQMNFKGSFVNKIISKIEKQYYDRIQLPDHVFVLQAKIEELRKRKTDIDFATHKIKAQAVNDIKESAQIHIIDANRPYSEVVIDLKRRMWKML